MKNKLKLITILMLAVLTIGGVTGCSGMSETTETVNGDATETEVKLSYEASFYTNSGEMWFQTVGSKLEISPNKVKQWGYSSGGTYTSWYETSSIVSIEIDYNTIDSCGSTAIFADTRLEPCNINFNGIVSEGSEDGSLTTTDNQYFRSWYNLKHWWVNKDLHKDSEGSKLIVIQSQLGNPIAMYMGDNVEWSLGELPKTTLIYIDDVPLYIHRANFAIIDTNLIEIGSENFEDLVGNNTIDTGTPDTE